jgi:hypothetical protein
VCWKKCGAVPLTMAPIHSGEVRQEVPVGAAVVAAAACPHMNEEDDGKSIQMLQRLEAMNGFYCDVLDNKTVSMDRASCASRHLNTALLLLSPWLIPKQEYRPSREQGLQVKCSLPQVAVTSTPSNEFFQARALADREADQGTSRQGGRSCLRLHSPWRMM